MRRSLRWTALLVVVGLWVAALAPAAIQNSIPLSQKGAANGVATLNGSIKLTEAQLPTILAGNLGGEAVTEPKLKQGTEGKLVPTGGSAGQALARKGTVELEWKTVSATASGPAGGVLAGEYPNPSLASEAVKTAGLANESVSEGKLAKAEVELIAAKATKTEAEGKLAKAENLKDLASAVTARTNLGLGSAAVEAASAFDAAGTSAAGVKVERERAEAAEVLKAPLASPALTGTPKAPTAAAKTSTEQLATTAFAQKTREEAEAASDPAGTSVAGVKVEKERAEAAEALKAPLANPVFTGTPKAPTAAAKTNTEQLASTAFTQTAKGEAETADKAAAAAEVKTEKERAEAAEATKLSKLAVHATITTETTVGAGELTPVNAESKALTEKLPEGSAAGTLIALEKEDSTANAVTIEGQIRSSAKTSTISLKYAHEVKLLETNASGYWYPLSDYITVGSLEEHFFAKSAGESLESLKAPLASPTFTGTPAAPTAAAKTNTTQLATTAFDQQAKKEAEEASVPLSQKGTAFGVAELEAGTKLLASELPTCVLASKVKALGKLAGATAEINLEEGSLFTATLEHEVTFKVTHAPSGCADNFDLITTENATGGFKWSVEALAWVNGEPSLVTTKSTTSDITMTAYESVLKGFGGIEGKTGPEGKEGKEGKEGPAGAAGGGAIQMLLPYQAHGSPVGIGEIAIGEADLAICSRTAPAYKTGTLKELDIYGGATKNGETKVAIFDLGTKTTEKWTVLWESSGSELETSKWTVYKPELSVTSGAEYMVCVMNSGTTQKYGEDSGAPGAAQLQEIPEALLKVSGKVAAKLVARHKYGSLSFGAAGAALSESEMLSTNATLSLLTIGRIE